MKKMLKQDLKMDIPDLAIDRAHRIGSVVEDPSTKKTYRHIIVRFTTWRHRTHFIFHFILNYLYRVKTFSSYGKKPLYNVPC